MAAAAEAAGGGDGAGWGRRRGEERRIEAEGAELAGEDVHGGHGRAWWRRGLSLSPLILGWAGWRVRGHTAQTHSQGRVYG